MDKFLKRHQLPKLTQGRIGHLNRPISIQGIESIFNTFPPKKAPDPGGITSEFH